MNHNKRTLAPAKIKPKEPIFSTNPNTRSLALTKIAPKKATSSTNANAQSLTTTKIAPKKTSSFTHTYTRPLTLTNIAPKKAASFTNPNARSLATTDFASTEASLSTNPDTRSLTTTDVPYKDASSSTNPNIRSLTATNISSTEIISSTTRNVLSIKSKKQTGWYDDNDDTRHLCSYDVLMQFLLEDNGKEYDVYTGKLEGKKIEVVERAVKYFDEKGYSHRKGASIKSKLETIVKAYNIANDKKNSPSFREIDPSRKYALLEDICRGYKLMKQHRENRPGEEEITVLRGNIPLSIPNAQEDVRLEREFHVDSDGGSEGEKRRPKKKAKLSAFDLQKNHIADALKIHREMKREQYAHERKEAIRKIKMQLPEMLMKGIEYNLAKDIVDAILSSYESEK